MCRNFITEVFVVASKICKTKIDSISDNTFKNRYCYLFQSPLQLWRRIFTIIRSTLYFPKTAIEVSSLPLVLWQCDLQPPFEGWRPFLYFLERGWTTIHRIMSNIKLLFWATKLWCNFSRSCTQVDKYVQVFYN